MAIDSKAKRSSCILGMLPPPDNKDTRPDRRQVGLFYRFSIIQSMSATAAAVLVSTASIIAYYNLSITNYGILDSHGYLTKDGETVLAGLVTKDQ